MSWAVRGRARGDVARGRKGVFGTKCQEVPQGRRGMLGSVSHGACQEVRRGCRGMRGGATHGACQEVPCGSATEAGQAAVELAALIPVVMVVALTVVVALSYALLCTRFDRAAGDVVVAQATSQDEQSLHAACEAIREQLQTLMGEGVTVGVTAERITGGSGAAGAVFSLLTSEVRFVCTLTYVPPLSHVRLAGINVELFTLTHEHAVTVDTGAAGIKD